jgi:predicted short-subunit dehydrogenase-like oxidoreductase (DUF2520 family)
LELPPEGTTAVILSVPDDVVVEVAESLARQGPAPAGCVAFHLSGALSTEALGALHVVGYPVGSLHPMQSLAHPLTGAELLPGSYFSIAGEPLALTTGRRLVSALGSRTLQVPAKQRPLYHAAAVLASNYLATLIASAARMLEETGISGEEALAALLPLAKGSLENLERLGPAQGLTGPVLRGDVETVRLHLRMLGESDRELYATLGRALLVLGMEAGLAPEVAHEMQRALEVG